jgi:hypothetical protein
LSNEQLALKDCGGNEPAKAEIGRHEGNWKDAMKNAMGKKNPASGWPK